MSIIFKRVRNMYKTNLLLFHLHYLQYALPVHGDKIEYEPAITRPITFIVCSGTSTPCPREITNALCVHYQIAAMMLPLHYQLPLPLSTRLRRPLFTVALATHYHYTRQTNIHHHTALRDPEAGEDRINTILRHYATRKRGKTN